MMSLSTIKAMDEERAVEAYEEGRRPMDISEAAWRIDVSEAKEGKVPSTLRGIPNLGDVDDTIAFHDGEYELVETLFLDKGALGGLWDSGGPALSIGGFAERGLELTKEHGTLHWMLGSEGQFQIHAFALRKLVD